MKKAIIGIGVAVVDILSRVSDEDIVKNGLQKGCWNSTKRLEEVDIPKGSIVVPGGSTANVIANSSYVGLRNENALIGTVGKDHYGNLYRKDLGMNGVTDYMAQLEGKTGVCHIFITPDHERTSVSDIGVSTDLRIPLEKLEGYNILHATMYEIESKEKESMEALMTAYKNKQRISFDLADQLLIDKRKSLAEDIVRHSSIVFANEHEAKALTGLGPFESVEALSKMCDVAVVKMGKSGSIVKKSNGPAYMIPCYPANAVDTTGAGDAYSAGFLYGTVKGLKLEECGHAGSFLAARVCEKYGGRMRIPE